MRKQRRPVTVLHTLWLSVFVIDAVLVGRGLAARLAALMFLLFFGALIFTELRSYRREDVRPVPDRAGALDRRTPSGH